MPRPSNDIKKDSIDLSISFFLYGGCSRMSVLCEKVDPLFALHNFVLKQLRDSNFHNPRETGKTADAMGRNIC